MHNGVKRFKGPMKETCFTALVTALRLPPAAERAVQKKLREKEKDIQKISETAYQGKNFALCKRMPLTRLTVILYLLPQVYAAYRAKGVSGAVAVDTFRDISLRARVYHEKVGKVGLFKEDVIWFRHIMNVNIFKIGALQFQPFKMIYLDKDTIGEDYMTFEPRQKEALPPGTPVVNCHIQRGADLSPLSVRQSLATAKAFFEQHFSPVRYRAFFCCSWLLYPPMVQTLSPRSNIRRFAERFTVIGQCGDTEQAAENLFENGIKNIPSSMTSLQRQMLEHKEVFGFACGIIDWHSISADMKIPRSAPSIGHKTLFDCD